MFNLNLSPTASYELVLHDTAGGVDGGIELKLRTQLKCKDVELVLAPFYQGPKGDTGGGIDSYTAGENLNATVPVYFENGQAFAASNLVPQQAGRVFGITTSAALAGQPVNIAVLGVLENLTWTFANGPVFLGDKVLTQAVPASGFLQILGAAMSATKLYVNLQQPFMR